MQYTVKHSCGHTETGQLFGSYEERQRRLAWLKETPCQPCKRQAEQQAAEQSAAAAGLPALSGSPKQVAWATTIRAEKLKAAAADREQFAALGRRQNATAEQMAEQLGQYDQAAAALAAHERAAWWIDRRNTPIRQLLKEASQEVSHA